jgi:hypothetical protein
MKRALALAILGVLAAGSMLSANAFADNGRHLGWYKHQSYNSNHRWNDNHNRNGAQANLLRDRLSRQEAIVNRLQARVDNDRRAHRTKTSTYANDLRALRLAQADYNRIEADLNRYTSYNY